MMSDLPKIIAAINAMRKRHNWLNQDSANILAKSIVVEANELLECSLTTDYDINEVSGELADVMMYALALADHLALDTEKIIEKKIQEINTRNYDE
jgi:NTP pyrophosphatase (non-canonical NTP hydrolase)